MKKKVLALALALVLLFAVMPAYSEAATTVPAKVATACKYCINENNKCVVVDLLASKIYVM